MFTFGLAGTDSDDGDGAITYMKGTTPYQIGAYHHVAATFDGETMSLYVDGKLDAASKAQTGDILYPRARAARARRLPGQQRELLPQRAHSLRSTLQPLCSG